MRILQVEAVRQGRSAAVEGAIVVLHGGAVVQAAHAEHRVSVFGGVTGRALSPKHEEQKE